MSKCDIHTNNNLQLTYEATSRTRVPSGALVENMRNSKLYMKDKAQITWFTQRRVVYHFHFIGGINSCIYTLIQLSTLVYLYSWTRDWTEPCRFGRHQYNHQSHNTWFSESPVTLGHLWLVSYLHILYSAQNSRSVSPEIFGLASILSMVTSCCLYHYITECLTECLALTTCKRNQVVQVKYDQHCR